MPSSTIVIHQDVPPKKASLICQVLSLEHLETKNQSQSCWSFSDLPVRFRTSSPCPWLLHGSGPSGCWALAKGAIWHIHWPRALREVRWGLKPGDGAGNGTGRSQKMADFYMFPGWVCFDAVSPRYFSGCQVFGIRNWVFHGFSNSFPTGFPWIVWNCYTQPFS